MAHNSDHIPGIAAVIWEGAPEDVYLNMWYDDLDFKVASENFFLAMEPPPVDEFDDEVYGVVEAAAAIEDVEPDAVEKAAYQSTINNQQIIGLVDQGFSIEEAVAMNPGTSGIMTPHGQGLDDDEVEIVMDAYPGLDAYTGIDINDWGDLDSYAAMIEEEGGEEIDTVMDNVEEIATNEGTLDTVMDFFKAAGSSIGDAITQTTSFLGQSVVEALGTVGEFQEKEIEMQEELGEYVKTGISEGLDKIVTATDGVVYADTGASSGLDGVQQELMNGLEAMGVGAMAQYLGDPSNYKSGELVSEDVQEWFDTLTAMGEDADTIEMLRQGFARRTMNPINVAEAENANTISAIVTAADNVAEAHIMEQIQADERAVNLDEQAANWEALVAEEEARDEVALAEEAATVMAQEDDTLDYRRTGLLEVAQQQAALEGSVEELEGADFDYEFWNVFNQLPGSGSSDAQTTIGPRLKEEAELLWYLTTDYADIDVDETLTEFLNANAGVEFPPVGESKDINFSVWRAATEEYTGEQQEEDSGPLSEYGQHVMDFFQDPYEQRYGGDFYKDVEALRDNMTEYDGLTQAEMITRWQDWGTEGGLTKHEAATEINQRALFIEGASAPDRLSALVAMYNTPKGSDAWYRNELQTIYGDLYTGWTRANKSPESFLDTFVTGNRKSDVAAQVAGGS
jgi:hypothetical protein